MKDWDKDWIHFSKRTRRGIFVLLVLFIMIAVSPRLYYNYIASAPKYDIQITPLADDEIGSQDQSSKEDSQYHQPKELFDPNHYSLEQWIAVGLSKKQAQSILNYLNSGAQFRFKSDLQKSYVIDSTLYKLLEPKINLPEALNYENAKYLNKNNEPFRNYTDSLAQQNRAEIAKRSASHNIKPVQINTASKKELETIPGIGPFFANEIVIMRESYGGIIDLNQLLTIYNMTQEGLDTLSPYLSIDKEHVKRMDVNSATEQELSRHPLISSDMAHSIVYYRKHYRKYKSLDELLLSPYIDSKTLKKLKPYLKVE